MSAPRSPSGESLKAGAPHALFWVIAATLAVRLIVGGLTHLTEDEAYYRLWSMKPALGYYDHPPMIAWWIWMGRKVAGDNPLGVRLLPILATAITSLLVFDLARLAGLTSRLAQRAANWFNAMLLVLAGGFLAVPDSPAALFWTLSVWCAFRAWRQPSTLWWIVSGGAAGLACLSKYSALFIAPGMLLWLTSSARGREQLRTAGPFLAAIVAAAIFALNVAWNAEHHWLTFIKQFSRVAPQHFAPRYLIELLAGQAILLNPLIAFFALVAATKRPGWTPNADSGRFFAMSAPFAIYLVAHSLHDRVQAHWPAPLYPLIAVCAVIGAERVENAKSMKRLAAWTPVVGFGVGAAALVLLITPGAIVGRFDPALPIRGWGQFASRIEAVRRATGASWVGTTSYGLASELSLERSLRGPTFQLSERDRWQNLAGGAPPNLSAPGLAIDLSRRISGGALRRCFSLVQPLGVLTRGAPGESGKTYAAFEVAGPRRDILTNGC